VRERGKGGRKRKARKRRGKREEREKGIGAEGRVTKMTVGGKRES